MPQVNPVPFVYEPIKGDLYLDHFRSMFYTERLDDVVEKLQQITVHEGHILREIEGELFFSDDEDEPVVIRDVRYHRPDDRSEDDGALDRHFPVEV